MPTANAPAGIDWIVPSQKVYKSPTYAESPLISFQTEFSPQIRKAQLSSFLCTPFLTDT